MSARSRIVVAVCAATAATAALSGCNSDDNGGSSAPLVVPAATTSASPAGSAAPGKDDPFAAMTADGLLTTAETNMRDARAMTMEMKVVLDGQAMHLKSAMTAAGACAAALRVGGENIQIITTDSTHTYMKADPAFWRAAGGSNGTRLATAVGDRWVKLTKKALDSGNLGGFCSLKEMMGSLLMDGQGSDDEVVKGAPVTLDGKQVIPLTETVDDSTDTMYVSTGKTPYVVKFESKGGDAPGTATFSDFGKAPHIAAPPASRIVDLASLGIDLGKGDLSV